MFKKLLEGSRLDPVVYADFKRNDLATVSELCCLDPAQLTVESPQLTAITVLYRMLAHNSMLTGTSAWPDFASTDAVVVAARVAIYRKLTMFVRLAASERVASDTRVKDQLGLTPGIAPNGKTNELALRHKQMRASSDTHQKEWCALTNRTYNSKINLQSTNPTTTVDTRIALETGTLAVSSLSGGNYSRKTVVKQPDKSKLHYDSERGMFEEAHSTVCMAKCASVLAVFYELLLSLVVAGHIAIDPLVSHLAGSHGMVTTASGEVQLHFTLWDALRVFMSFVNLSAVLGPGALAERIQLFLTECDTWMCEGHSLSSATVHVVGSCSWMRPHHQANLNQIEGLHDVSASPSQKSTGASSSGEHSAVDSAKSYKSGKSTKKGIMDDNGELTHVTVAEHKRLLEHEKGLADAKGAKCSRLTEQLKQRSNQSRGGDDRERFNNDGRSSSSYQDGGRRPSFKQ